MSLQKTFPFPHSKNPGETFAGWATESRQLSVSVRQMLARRISESGGGSLPPMVGTPTTRPRPRSPKFAKGRTPNVYETAMWPTPQAHKTTKSGEIVNADGTPWDGISKPHSKTTNKPITSCLADSVAMWPARIPTPTAGDSKSAANATANRKPGSKHHAGTTLTDYVRLPTPTSSEHKDRLRGNSQAALRCLNALARGQLNPTWVEWLMGWPLEWTALKPSATAKCR